MNPNSPQTQRILWRQRVLSCTGGPEWLTEESRKWKHNERQIGPALIPPPAIQQQMQEE